MKIYIIDQNGDLALQNGRSIVVEFADGKSLELAGSPQPLPEESLTGSIFGAAEFRIKRQKK